MHPLGFIRVSAVSPAISVANPIANVESIMESRRSLTDSDVLVFPELAISGYTCGDLFLQSRLLDDCLDALRSLIADSSGVDQLWVVGLPIRIEGRLFNTAAMIHNGKLLGLIPKQYLPTYQEFYEARWFSAGSNDLPAMASFDGLGEIPFGVDLLFECGELVVGVEICEDLWMPVPPSSIQALAGANLLLNLSASNETIGKASYRTNLVTSQSGRCLAAYAYSSSGPTESTTDLVFGGHCLIAENGILLDQSKRVGTGGGLDDALNHITVDVDLGRLLHDRQKTGTFFQGVSKWVATPFRRIPFSLAREPQPLKRFVSGQPFVPKDHDELDARRQDIFEIQCAALAKRIGQIPTSLPLAIGVSGGLDSTLALLVAIAMCDDRSIDRQRILGITMPGFGTSKRTMENAEKLMSLLGIQSTKIDIRENCLQGFRDLKHPPFGIPIGEKSVAEFQAAIEALPSMRHSDLVFENVQARVRTLLLMNSGFVLGTGDLSEQALGWSTYNADHMSMYNVNCSIPKTLVRFLVRYVAEHRFENEIRDVLLSIADTPISPELLPLSKDGQIQQSTEGTLGAYELHDFFLYHFIRTGASPEKILLLAESAEFSVNYDAVEIRKTLETFLKRFFANQFKRSCVPDGPKVGSISLSPRGDWRMPSDASVQSWLRNL
ncbi:MAG: NAD(+) synthase [Pirellulaceae bacterium]|nr:NAD(+) synthase [Pirellulaceae bacterium]